MATVDCDHDRTNPFDDRDDLHDDAVGSDAVGSESDAVGTFYEAHLDGAGRSAGARGAGSRGPGSLGNAAHLHRIAEVRQRQGVTLRNVARRLGMSLPVVRRQEQSDCDLRLSDVHRWQQVLEVPVAELLVEGEGSLSGPVLHRARMVKLMKTAAAIRERVQDAESERLVGMLVEQILEIMPELSDVSPWPSPGQRRTLDDVGRTARVIVSEEVFRQRS
jgi:transcriptional regulator with XRE-family HTH domain